MAHAKKMPAEWLAYALKHTKADFDKGEIWWAISAPGRQFNKPLGCKDANGYVKLSIARKSTYAHRVIWLHATGEWPDLIDHIDRDRSNNRLINLRAGNEQLNNLNRDAACNSRTGVRGVQLDADGRYRVTIAGTFYGRFHDFTEAAEVARCVYSTLGI